MARRREHPDLPGPALPGMGRRPRCRPRPHRPARPSPGPGPVPRRKRPLDPAQLLHQRHRLAALIGHIPAPVLADLLALHPTTTVRWATLAKRDWTSYLNARAEDLKRSNTAHPE